MAINISIQVSGNVSYYSIPVSASFSSGGSLAYYYRFFIDGVGDGPMEQFSSPVTSVTKYHTYTGLKGDTSYTLTVHFFNSSRTSLGSNSITIRTPKEPDTTPPTITRWGPSAINKTSVEMTASASDSSGVSGFYFYLDGTSVGVGYGSSVTRTFSNLIPGKTYSLGVKAFDIYNNDSSMTSYSVTTKSNPPPNIDLWYATQIGTNSITMYVSASDDEGVAGYWFFLNNASVTPTNEGSGRYTFKNLMPDTSYNFGVKAYDGYSAQSVMSTYTMRTKKNRPVNFDWDTAKYTGSSFNVTANEWNRLCNKINEFRSYIGLTNVAFTSVSKGTSFKASYYNELVNAIKAISPPTSAPNVRDAGDTVYASDINKLRESLNSIL
ncbi:hypothetical protein [Fontibacillus sp. BL9]|uniref:hypothetical protein n=1 Tax=Fontibacillus sp. BL9 TaxID=3389971 RepID=UPI00397938BE